MLGNPISNEVSIISNNVHSHKLLYHQKGLSYDVGNRFYPTKSNARFG